MLAEYLRSWQGAGCFFCHSASLAAGIPLDYRPLASHWAVHADGTWSKGEGFSAYNNVSNEVVFPTPEDCSDR